MLRVANAMVENVVIRIVLSLAVDRDERAVVVVGAGFLLLDARLVAVLETPFSDPLAFIFSEGIVGRAARAIGRLARQSFLPRSRWLLISRRRVGFCGGPVRPVVGAIRWTRFDIRGNGRARAVPPLVRSLHLAKL